MIRTNDVKIFVTFVDNIYMYVYKYMCVYVYTYKYIPCSIMEFYLSNKSVIRLVA